MRRMTSTILAVLVLFCSVSAVAYAANAGETIRLENGDYIEVTVRALPVRAAETKSGAKNYSYYYADDTLAWQAVLSATFTYNGTSSSCTSASCSVSVYDNDWYVVSKSAVKDGDTAVAKFMMEYKSLGVTMSKDTYRLTLSCDKNGNVS